MLTEMVADQVAPSYWVPNKDVYVRGIQLFRRIYTFFFYKKCSSCDLQFGSDFSKHHCRCLFENLFKFSLSTLLL
jgi:hypothetical protein